MSKPKPQDPEKRAAKAKRRKIRRALEAAGVEMTPRQRRRSGLLDHGSSPRKQRHRREGEARIERERGVALPTLDELRERRVPLDGQA